jgi:hypothetical protein
MELSGFNVPTTVHDFIPLMIAGVWPVTVLILGFWFSKEIKNLIKSLKKVEFKNVSLTLDTRAIAERPTNEVLSSPEAKQISEPSTPKWGNVANLFWLGNDLEWTMQTLLQNAPIERVIHGFTKVTHHSSELGLADSTPGKLASALKAQVKSLAKGALDKRQRDALAEELLSVVKGFDILVRQKQPDFRPDPER